MNETTMAKNGRVMFDKLRARYLDRYGKWSEFHTAMRAKYGGDYRESWFTTTETRKDMKLREAMNAAQKAFIDYITEISPRYWKSGVPVHWLCEKLTYEDAVRPVDQALSVVPPLAYGATDPIQ